MAIKLVAVGVDSSDGSHRAVDWTARFATDIDADVLAIHVVSRTWLIELNALQIETTEMIKQATFNLRTVWTRALREHQVRYRTELVNGDPARDLLGAAASRHADLLVIGGTHHSGVRDALLGGTAHHVVNRAAIPVVVVPAPVDDRRVMPPIPG